MAGEKLFDLTLTGELALDFINAIDWRLTEAPKELFNSYSDLLRWARHTNILTEAEAAALENQAASRPGKADEILGEAIVLRELLFDIFAAIAREQKPSAADFEVFNRELRNALSHLSVADAGENYVWRWDDAESDLKRVSREVLRGAAELLTSGRLKDLRECPGAGCAWLFIDTSRNKARRWCSMDVCGNRAKAKRHYEKAKSN